MPSSLLLLLLSAWSVSAPPPPPSDVVVEVAHLQFRSDPLYNLHHVLYAAAWARRPEQGTRAANAGALPAPLDAPLTDDERKVWSSAIDFYDKNLASHALLSQKM